jgi:hypothetical protein
MHTPSKRNACHSPENRLSKAAFLGMMLDDSQTKIYFQNLNEDQWTITSFDHVKREVCIEITSLNSMQTHNITYMIPVF